MPWICSVCHAQVDGRETDDPPNCYQTKRCKFGQRTWEAPRTEQWTSETANLRTSRNRSDLEKLIDKFSGNPYSTNIQTLVGGESTRGKHVKGLADDSARIDVQNPPGNGAYQIAYQTGKSSHACVLFTDDDPESTLLQQLLLSFDNCKKRKSPSAQRIINQRDTNRNTTNTRNNSGKGRRKNK